MGIFSRKLLLLFLIMVFIGCSNQRVTYIKPNQVEWIGLGGGGYASEFKNVIFNKKSTEKINKIITLIDQGKNQRLSTKVETEVVYFRHIGYVQIRLVNGKDLFIYPAGRVIQKKEGQGIHYRVEPSTDNFIMEVDRNDKYEGKYYTLTSKDFVTYFRDGLYNDIPGIKEEIRTPKQIKFGEKFVISGTGFTDRKVKVVLTNHIFNYTLDVIPVKYGDVKWEGILKPNIITHDGEKLTLEEGRYGIGILLDNNQRISNDFKLTY